MLLEKLENAEAKCDVLQAFVERYHQADKRVAVLEEKLKANLVIDVSFTVGFGVGCSVLGLIPTFWDGTAKGPAALAVGLILVVGSVIVRIIRR